MLAVSRNLERLKDELRRTSELDNTYLILTSDNGYHLGEHRLGAGKMPAYEGTCASRWRSRDLASPPAA